MIMLNLDLKSQVHELLLGLVDDDGFIDGDKFDNDIYEFILADIRQECINIADEICEENDIQIKWEA